MFERISQKLIGYRVKAAREAKAWTQDQLTQALGLNDRQSVSDIENGKRALKSDEMLAISELLDRDVDFFSTRSPSRARRSFPGERPRACRKKSSMGLNRAPASGSVYCAGCARASAAAPIH
ncbi:hypothetical protein OJJOAM_004785 [Cupriavidus sp. H18C1]|uniref:helix-turn-helix domain-containing protein n=1 Tax=Cupriavidus sp. H18C1 TaxID=3241601 RepID=UPI003BB9672E